MHHPAGWVTFLIMKEFETRNEGIKEKRKKSEKEVKCSALKILFFFSLPRVLKILAIEIKYARKTSIIIQ